MSHISKHYSMLTYRMSNPNIKEYASMGGRARASKVLPEVRVTQARQAAIKRWGGHKQALKCLPIPEETYPEWKERERLALRQFIYSKGGDPDEIIEAMGDSVPLE